jgi:peptidoglycan/LPS O-acetylase OafA/YrhL
MDKRFSLYLDLIRFLAAVLVVLSHYPQLRLMSGSAVALIPNFGREAVIVFFVLSGFVIAYTTAEKAASLRQYAVARCARVYSVAVPVVLASFLVAMIASQYFGLTMPSGYQALKPYIYLPLHFLFMGELWSLSETPPWLLPYWSLGYEVWYYVLFGVAFYLRGVKRLLLAGLVLLVMGPKLWLLLPVWLAGAWLYSGQKALAISRGQARAGWLATIVILCAYKYFALDVALRALGSELWPFALKLGTADRYLADYVVCIIIYLHFLFARQAQFGGLMAAQAPIRSLASYTFTLYLVHGLVMGWWRQFYPHDPTSLVDIAMLTAAIGLATYAFGFVTEKRKAGVQHMFDSLYAFFFRRYT